MTCIQIEPDHTVCCRVPFLCNLQHILKQLNALTVMYIKDDDNYVESNHQILDVNICQYTNMFYDH